ARGVEVHDFLLVQGEAVPDVRAAAAAGRRAVVRRAGVAAVDGRLAGVEPDARRELAVVVEGHRAERRAGAHPAEDLVEAILVDGRPAARSDARVIGIGVRARVDAVHVVGPQRRPAYARAARAADGVHVVVDHRARVVVPAEDHARLAHVGVAVPLLEP